MYFALVVVLVAVDQLAVRIFTGAWGGTVHDPLWVGPVSGAIGMTAGLAAAFYVHFKPERHRKARPRRAVGCSHMAAVPVESIVTGDLLAVLCPTCDQQLPAEFWEGTLRQRAHLASTQEPQCPACDALRRLTPAATGELHEGVGSWPAAMF